MPHLPVRVKGSLVLSEDDPKEPAFMMKVIGHKKNGCLRCKYIYPDANGLVVEVPCEKIRDPHEFGLSTQWGKYPDDRFRMIQQQWKLAQEWNTYPVGTEAIIESINGDTRVVTIGVSYLYGDLAVIPVMTEKRHRILYPVEHMRIITYNSHGDL